MMKALSKASVPPPMLGRCVDRILWQVLPFDLQSCVEIPVLWLFVHPCALSSYRIEKNNVR